MLQPLLLLENESDPESVTSLDTSSLPSSLQQLQHKKKLNTTQKLILLLFCALFFQCSEIKLCKAITHIENRIANTNAKSDSVCDQANPNCLRRVHGKRSHTCLEIESKYNFKLKKGRDNVKQLILFTRNGESHIQRDKTCSRGLWPPNIS